MVLDIWLAFIFIWSFIHFAHAVDCFTCSVDFRAEPYDQNNSCLFPKRTEKYDDRKTSCSRESKYCQGIITRINGVFVQLQRTCEADCDEYCTEKGFGIETSECIFCCNDSVKESAQCGFQGYKSSVQPLHPFAELLAFHFIMLLIYEYAYGYGSRGRKKTYSSIKTKQKQVLADKY